IDGSATAAAPVTSPAASERKAGPLDVRSGKNGGSGGQASVSGGFCLTSSNTWRARGPSAVGVLGVTCRKYPPSVAAVPAAVRPAHDTGRLSATAPLYSV